MAKLHISIAPSQDDTAAPSWASNIAGLRELFLVLITAAGGAVSEPNKVHSLVRLIRRVARLIMTAEAAVIQRKLKSDMLSDAAWRWRVYAQLGGFHEMRRWRDKFRKGAQAERPN